MLTAMAYTTLKLHKKRLQKLPLEDLREFLQEELSVSFFLPDDVVIEQLQAAMTELRSKKLNHPPSAKSEELPRKPLGQERPAPNYPDSPLEVKFDLQEHSQSSSEVREADAISLHPTISLEAEDCRNITPPLSSLDPVEVHSPLKPCRPPPTPPKAKKLSVNEAVPLDDQIGVHLSSQLGQKELQEEQVEWPPPYEPPALDTVQTQAENIDLPELPPPPFCYTEESTSPKPEPQKSTPNASPDSQVKPKIGPKPITSLDILQKKPSPTRIITSSSASSPSLPPPKPTKFPVSLYVPVHMGDRRPSNTSQYDNLSEGDDDERCIDRLLATTPEELPNIPKLHSIDKDYDPIKYPLPPPPMFIPPSPSPPLFRALNQEPLYEGDECWSEDSVIMAPPPSTFADRLAPFQSSGHSCSDIHRATSPNYSKAFTRSPRDRTAFPAPLLYTGSPSGQRATGQSSSVGVPLVRSSPDFCRMPPVGQQLHKSVTFG